MRWNLLANEKTGPDSTQTKREWVEKLQEDGIDPGNILPPEPELYSYLTLYWNAFHILSSSRDSGMSIGAIPLPAYESYFRILIL